ncbi:MAG: hypothetical protein VYD19_10560, partial [Myxococcota bacterium]|nr:hypothetical protein [Myxococcota bacterium]
MHRKNQSSALFARLSWLLAGLLLSLPFVRPAGAVVGGERQALYANFRLFGGMQVTGNSLMTASPISPLVNSRLLPSSSGDIRGLPFDAVIEGAYLFWTGSTLNQPDRDADLTLADGAQLNNVRADRCREIDAFGGFFYCRADVTEQLRAHPGAQRYNGRYSVGDVRAEPGTLDRDGQCVEPRECQAKYAAWSLVLIYSSASETTLRDLSIYDGFLQLDEDESSPGIDQFFVRGFDFPQDGAAELTFFAREGDELLGVPPQDGDPLFTCDSCFDFLEVNGRKLEDARNPPNNLFNSSTALGVDLDSFSISDQLRAGDQQLQIRVGSGDGRVNPMNPDPAGGGELFLLGYVALSLDRNAPSFRASGNQLSVVPDEAAPRERVVFTWRIENEGSLSAEGLVARLQLPAGLSYFPGSLRIDGADPVPGNEVNNPLAAGLSLGNLSFQGDNDREISFRATLDPGLVEGQRLISRGRLSSRNLPNPVNSNDAVVVVLGELGLSALQKRVEDGDGDGRFTPGEQVRYTIRLVNPNQREVAGVTLRDQRPPYLDLLQVLSPSGLNRSVGAENRVLIEEIVVPGVPERGLDVIILAQVHDLETLTGADGVPAGEVNGLLIENQAEVSAAGELRRSDDPTTPQAPDATSFILSADLELSQSGSRKEVIDLNGGLVEPGDLLEYRIRVRNSGAAAGEVTLDDPLPPLTEACVIRGAPAGVRCEGGRVAGRFLIGADDLEQVSFQVRVVEDAAHQGVIENVAVVQSATPPVQRLTLRSPRLTVTAAPDLSRFEKRSLGGATIAPGGVVSYELLLENRGNRPAVAAQLIDPLPFEPINLEAGDGVYDPGSRSVRWALGEIAPGATVSRQVSFQIPADLGPGAEVVNQARFESVSLPAERLSDDPATPAEGDPTRIIVEGMGVQLRLRKEVSPRQASPGMRVRYTLTLTNAGDTVARAARVEDRLPAGFFTEITTPEGELSGDRVVFSAARIPALTRLEPGEQIQLTIDAQVGEGGVGEVAVNQATALADGVAAIQSDDPNTAAPLDGTRLEIVAPPTLRFEKQVEDLNGAPLSPGDLLRYTLTLTPEGAGQLIDLRVTDPIPTGLEEVVPLDGGVRVGARLEWTLGAVDASASRRLRFEARVSAESADDTLISNQARALAIGLDRLSDDPATPEVGDPTLIRVEREASLSTPLKEVSPRELSPGAVATWQITLQNSGGGEARDLIVEDPLPAGLEEIEVIGGVLRAGRARWELARLGPGQSRTLTLRARVTADFVGEAISNQARVSGEGIPAQLTDDPALPGPSDPTLLRVLPPANFIFETGVTALSADGRFEPGERALYQLRLSTLNPVEAGRYTMIDQLPEGLSVLRSPGATVEAGTLRWTVPALAAGASFDAEVEVRISEALPVGTLIDNQARLLEAGNPQQLSDDPSTAAPDDPTRFQLVGTVDLSNLLKRVDALDEPSFLPGGRVRYTIEAENRGSIEAQAIVLRDLLPDELEAISAVGAEINGQEVTWNLGALGPTESRRLTLEVRIRPEVSPETIIRNRASINAEGLASPFLSDNPETAGVDPTSFIVAQPPRLRLEKSVEAAEERFQPGALVRYTLRLLNEGPGRSAPTLIRDPLPAELGEVNAEGATIETGELRWLVPPLQVNEEAALSFTGRLNGDLADGTRVLNQAIGPNELLSDDPRTVEPNDPTALEVRATPTLVFTKTAPESAAPGEALTYQISLESRANKSVLAVEVSDRLPPGFEVVELIPAAPVEEGIVRWSLPRIAPGERFNFVIVGRLSETLEDRVTLENQAQLQGSRIAPQLSDDPRTPEPGDPTRTEIISGPRLELEKRQTDGNGPPLRPGDPLTYELVIRNQGAVAARLLEIVDPYPPQLTEVEAVGGELLEGIARWRSPRLEPGAELVVRLRGRVSEAAVDGDELVNQFGARAGSEPFQTSPEIRARVQLGRLRLDKSVEALDGSFRPGGRVRYRLSLVNEGASALESLNLLDPIPEGLEVIEVESGGLQGAEGLLWSAGTTPAFARLEPGDSETVSFTARIGETLRPGAEVLNQAIARFDGAVEALSSDDPSTAASGDPTRFVVAEGPLIRFEKSIDRPSRDGIEPGERLRYVLSIENRGSTEISLPPLTDLPEGQIDATLGSVRLNGVSLNAAGDGLFSGGLALEAPLAAGAQIEVSYEAQVRAGAAPGSLLVNQATLLFDDGPLRSDDPLTPAPLDATVLLVSGRPELTLEKRALTEGGADLIPVGETITWSLRWQNVGDGPALQLIMEDLLPAETQFIPGSATLDGRLLSDIADEDPFTV